MSTSTHITNFEKPVYALDRNAFVNKAAFVNASLLTSDVLIDIYGSIMLVDRFFFLQKLVYVLMSTKGKMNGTVKFLSVRGFF